MKNIYKNSMMIIILFKWLCNICNVYFICVFWINVIDIYIFVNFNIILYKIEK